MFFKVPAGDNSSGLNIITLKLINIDAVRGGRILHNSGQLVQIALVNFSGTSHFMNIACLTLA
ncbi:hypothetical protein TUM4641_06320 [Shewanella morhuae]|nr:hypothetical protein TUM4641_06320 [Shewanella morhuae]